MASGVCDGDCVPLVFRLHEGTPQLVREVLLERGWKEYDEQEQEEGDWNLYWRASAFRSSDYDNILPWQRLNHHPKMVGITRKDYLARNLKRMRGTFGSGLYDFSPNAFILPNDYPRFLAEYTKLSLKNGDRSGYWICKPVDQSRGRGIFVFKDLKDLVYDCSVIVQKYISNPLLIAGYKFDLRIYVCVKSFQPLTIYMHQEGLVRFEKYNLSSLDNLYSHLTNTSINKFGPYYTTNKEKVGQGCKWTMSKFRRFLHSQGVNELLFWQKINSIVTLTLLTIAPSIPSRPNCVELLGFDILIDARYRPWLLEVNYSPALTLDCQADVTVKKGILHDLVDLMNYTSVDSLRQRAYFKQKYKRPCYLGSQAAQTPMLLLPESMCKHQPANRTGYSNHSPFAHSARYYLPAVEMNRIHSGRNFISHTGGSALSPIQIPHSKTAAVARNRKTRPARSHMTEAIHCSEVTDVKSKFGERDMPTPDSLCKDLREPAVACCKLPAIHIKKYKTHKLPLDCKCQDNCTPPLSVGNFILTFPFNEVTLKASRDKLNVKTAIYEVHKLIKQVASGRSHEESRRRVGDLDIFKEQNKFCSLLWGPTNPPLLSECYF
ncbi:probable tubulin polyglutamylase TTLL2 [Esox lucius]|uniref:Tubulin tyrosine ligase-like family, member 2 n=1 Tax=Esox lucius TaxID=8010 RepID=A0AAY5K620_ESOLU|nr:probable tubulin polyglutamylase TTLL2 [Esox lucius]